MYHVISTCFTVILLYLISYFFYRIGYYSLQLHRKFWNSVLAASFLLTAIRSEEDTSELQSRQYLHSFPTQRSSDLIFNQLLFLPDWLLFPSASQKILELGACCILPSDSDSGCIPCPSDSL